MICSLCLVSHVTGHVDSELHSHHTTEKDMLIALSRPRPHVFNIPLLLDTCHV